MGLDIEYSTIKAQILSMKPTPSLKVTYHLVTEDEQQRAISTVKRSTTEVAVFQTFIPNRMVVDHKETNKKPTQRDGKHAGHEEPDQRSFYRRKCHIKNGCFKKIGYH